MSSREFDYVVVGSGAGGGPLAANLAKAGYRVCLMEAGKRPPNNHDNSNVPVFHPFATEDARLGWFTYVRHYQNQRLQEKDDKFQKSEVPDTQAPENRNPGPPYRYPRNQPKNGVFYPRASTLGGCTTHHALITVYPHNADWEDIVERTGDWTWNAENMRRYFEQLERCNYRPVAKFFARTLGINPTRHGFNGWLPTKVANLKLLKRDKQLRKLVFDSAIVAHDNVSSNPVRRLLRTLVFKADYNTWGLVKRDAVGLRIPALSINRQLYRSAVKEYIEKIETTHPENLTVKTNVLVERVVFEDEKDAQGKWVARGVRYYEHDDAYEASAAFDPDRQLGEAKIAFASREVILSAGAYQTPQLLMLSGIGDHAYLRKLINCPNRDRQFQLAERDLKVHLPGVGRNLQDRYEVGLVQRMKRHFDLIEHATYSNNPRDPYYAAWKKGRDGVYATNGAVLAIVKKSKPERELPDLYIFGVVGPFRGYEPGYSAKIRETNRKFTWAILKAHTRNTAGCVELNRDEPFNPRRLPHINFKYFSEGSDVDQEDLDSLVEGVKFVRAMTKEAEEIISEEEYPGTGPDQVPTGDEEKIRQWIAANAWGHHASCTCPMGLESHSQAENGAGYLAVTDSKFRVFGTANLRVVDASVFPRIPGFFIVLPIFMISQKASEQIIMDAKSTDRRRNADGISPNR